MSGVGFMRKTAVGGDFLGDGSGIFQHDHEVCGRCSGLNTPESGIRVFIKPKGDAVLLDNEWRRNTYDRIKQVHEN